MADAPRDPQEAALALEFYQRQLDAVSRQIEFLQGVLDEVHRAKRTLEGLEEATSHDVLVPMGAATFVHGTVDAAGKVIVGIGAGYATERTRQEAVAHLEARIKQTESELDNMMQAAVQLQQQAAQLTDRFDEETDA